MEEVKKQEVVVLDADNKEMGLKELKRLYESAAQLHQWLDSDTLTIEMKETLFSLIESYTAGASKYIGFDSMAQDKIDKMHKDIREANGKITELRAKLADNTDPDAIKEFLSQAHGAMYKWWKSFGFSLVTDDSFHGFGYKARFCLDISMLSFMSTHPSKDKQDKADRLQQMLDDGWKLKIPNRERDYYILDTPDNRDRIYAILRKKFRSASITNFANRNLGQSDEFYLRDCEVIIYDYQEIKDLIESMKTAEEDDE